MSRVCFLVAAAALAAGAWLSLPALAAPAPSSYLYIDGVAGNSQAAGHKNWLALDSFSTGYDAPGSCQGSTGAGQVTVTRKLDAASPKLEQSATRGQPYRTMKLDSVEPNRTTLTYTLENVLISAYRPGQKNAAQAPTETLTLNYSKISWKYAPCPASIVKPPPAPLQNRTN